MMGMVVGKLDILYLPAALHKKYLNNSVWIPFLLFFPLFSSAISVRIGVFYGQVITSVQVGVQSGKYDVRTGHSHLRTISHPDKINITLAGNAMLVTINEEKLFADSVSFVQAPGRSVMKISPSSTGGSPVEINGTLGITIFRNKLSIVNTMDIEDYVASVVDAEAGRLRHIEYYKAQAVLCRTYTLSNLDRHFMDDFDLCDGTHCQKFNGLTNYTDVIIATKAVKNMVLVDRNYELIISAYHSNCGGMTANSRYAWTEQVYYLVPVTDTFCLSQKHSRWHITIPEHEWRKYLTRLFSDSAYLTVPDSALVFSSHERYGWYRHQNDSVPFSRMRSDWKLNSPFFDISFNNGTVVLNGKGYGHGVGLCQEGAMKSAALGHSYRDIIKHYYTGVFFMDMTAMNYYLIN